MIQYLTIDMEADSLNNISFPVKQRFHEIVWIRQGHVSLLLDGEDFEIDAGAFLVIPSGRIKQFISAKGVRGLFVRFSEDIIKDFPKHLFSKFNQMATIHLAQDEIEKFELLFKVVELEYSSLDANNPYLANLISLIIQKLAFIKEKQIIEDSKPMESLCVFNAFEQMLEKHIPEKKTIHFYASKLNLTPRKLNDVVKNLFGKSATALIAERLMIEARRDLLYSDNTIYQIAYALGFKDNSHFTKFFKKHSNLTPKEFRNRCVLGKN